MFKMNRLTAILIFLLLSLVITLLSGFYQRPSNEIVQWGTECAAEYWFQCFHPNLSGGFPFAFIFDSPNTSVHNSLGAEDDFRWYPFIINIWLYFIALIFSYKTLFKRRIASKYRISRS